MFLFGGQVTLDGSQVTANETTSESSGQGGGIFVLGGALRLARSAVTTNVAPHAGGGLFISSGAVTLDESSVTGNRAPGTLSEGGGIKILGGALTLSGTAVTGNTAAAGGGIYFSDGTVSVDPGSISANTPDNCAGETVSNCVN